MDARMTLFNQPNIPLEIKWNVLRMVFNWLDAQPVGRKFGPREIQNHIEDMTAGARRPQDGTITRYIRKYNELGGHVVCDKHADSIYSKTKQRMMK